MGGNFTREKPRQRARSKPNYSVFPRNEFSREHGPNENLPMHRINKSNHVLIKTFFHNRNFRRHKESSHVTCYQACRPFEIFIICLAFLLMQKVNVTAITVKSTSRELDGESFSNCQGTFVKLFSVINFCNVLSFVKR